MADPPRLNRQRAEGYAPPPRLVRQLGGYGTVHPVNNGEQGRYATLEEAQAADVAYEEANPNLFSEERRRQLAEDRLRRWEAMLEGRELLYRLQNWRGGGGGGGPPPAAGAVSGAPMSVVDRVFSEYYKSISSCTHDAHDAHNPTHTRHTRAVRGPVLTPRARASCPRSA